MERTYKKRYRMNRFGYGSYTTMVAIPPEVVRREAEEAGMTPEEFVETHRAIAEFDGFDGVRYTFEPIPQELANATSG